MIFINFFLCISMSASAKPLSESIALTPFRQKSPFVPDKKGLWLSSPHLISQGIFTLLELAPAFAVSEPVAVASSGQSLCHSG